MQANETLVLEFIKANPNTNKAAITEATQLKGLPLFNLLKKLATDGLITSTGEGSEMTYSAAEITTEQTDTLIENINTDKNEGTPEKPSDEDVEEKNVGGEDKALNDQNNKQEEGGVEKTEVVKKPAGRNNDKFSFNGESDLSKGSLARSIVGQYVKDNPDTTYKKLKEIFPDVLLKRFGIFQDIDKAREISGPKYDRYFFKVEHIIKLKDKQLVVCNQWTSENIQPLILKGKELGYTIK